jgi:hypothetical protein
VGKIYIKNKLTSGTLNLEPHALHLIEVVHGGDALPRELAAHGLRLSQLVGPQHVLGRLAVDVPVRRVHGLRLVQPPHRLLRVSRVLVDLTLAQRVKQYKKPFIFVLPHTHLNVGTIWVTWQSHC